MCGSRAAAACAIAIRKTTARGTNLIFVQWRLAVRNVPVALLVLQGFVCQGLFGESVPPLICASGGAVATIDLRVVSSSPNNTEPLPLRTIVRLEEGDTIWYKPVLRPHEERKGDVTLVLVPANPKTAGRDKLLIFDPKPAEKPQEWRVPWRTSLAAFVYGPSGLNVKKVEAFLGKDDEVIGALADYADKTAKTEALIAALTANDNSPEAVNSALQGFSSQYMGSAQLKGTPMNQQTMIALQTLNPRVATYDPLSGQDSQSFGQTASLATTVAEMFFGSPIGLAAGGTAMLMNLGAMAFPKSEFRSTFSQAMPDDAMGLCGKTGAVALHTRVAYIWAARIPNAAAPKLEVGKSNSLPGTVKSPLPLAGPEGDWKNLDRARNWVLEPDRGKPIPVKVQVLANTKSIEVDLGKEVKPGRYSLSAKWDWDQFQVNGFFDVRPLADFKAARLTPAAQDRLVTNMGKLPLTLEGGDFEFVTKVEIKKLNDEFATASAVPFVLPQGLRDGVQDHMDIQVDTSGQPAGAYQLLVSQVDGKAHDVGVKLLPPLPAIENLPVLVNQDVPSVSFDLKGKRLDLIQSIEVSKGKATLGPASDDGTGRKVTFELKPGLKAGETLSISAVVADRNEPVTIADALRVVASRPAIGDVTISQFPSQAVQLANGELPGHLAVSVMMRVANLPADGGVRLECEQTTEGAIRLQPGQQSGAARLEQLTPDELFLTFDTGAWINGCAVQATITSGLGDSAPRRIARIVDVPAIDEFDLTSSDGGQTGALITGRNLETIARAGWTPDQCTPIAQLPQPLADGSAKQQLDIKLAAPPGPDAVLYVWLRGESKARVTTVHAN